MSNELATTLTPANLPAVSRIIDAGWNLSDDFEAVQQVTRSVLSQRSMPSGTIFYIEVQSPIFVSQRLENALPSDPPPPEMLEIVNLETGELQYLIVNKTLGGELRRAYPDNSYVGRCFAITRTATRNSRDGSNKNYATYRILEIRRKPRIECRTPAEEAAFQEFKARIAAENEA